MYTYLYYLVEWLKSTFAVIALMMAPSRDEYIFNDSDI